MNYFLDGLFDGYLIAMAMISITIFSSSIKEDILMC